MKATFGLLAAIFFGAIYLHAGPEDLVKQRAKNLRDQNNAQQGVPTTPPPSRATPPPATTPTIAAPPKPLPTAKIRADIVSWESQKSVSDDLKKTFGKDLLAAVRGSKSPSTAAVDKFSESLATALAGKTLGPNELSRVVQNINLSLNSHGLSDDRKDEIAAEVQKDLASAGVAEAAAATAGKDLRAMMADLSL